MEIKAEYKNDLRKQYLVLEEKEEGYQSRMLLNNQIPGLVGVELREWNNKRYYYYDITGCISLRETFQKKAPEIEEIRLVLKEIMKCCTEAESYLLDEKDFLLHIEYIYRSADGDIKFICYPGYQMKHGEQVCTLMEGWMECLDYKNRHVVSLVYLLYSRSRQSECSVFCLLDLCDELIAAEREDDRKEEVEIGKSEPRQEVEKKTLAKSPTKKKGFLKTIEVWLQQFKSKLKGMYGEEEVSAIPQISERQKEIAEIPLETERLEAAGMETERMEMEMETVLLSVAEEREEYRLEAMEDGRETIVMHQFPFYLGKEHSENGYCFKEAVISRKHARIEKEEKSFYLTDLDSKNGTFLNGERLLPQECRHLELGDIVGFADIYYIFTCSKTSNVL